MVLDLQGWCVFWGWDDPSYPFPKIMGPSNSCYLFPLTVSKRSFTPHDVIVTTGMTLHLLVAIVNLNLHFLLESRVRYLDPTHVHGKLLENKKNGQVKPWTKSLVRSGTSQFWTIVIQPQKIQNDPKWLSLPGTNSKFAPENTRVSMEVIVTSK